MQELRTVIELAAGKMGSAKSLAEDLGVSPQRVTEWKNGHRPCPLHSQAQIAEMAGIDAKDWVWRQVCRQLGRATAAVLLTLAASLAAWHVPGADGGGRLFRRCR